MVVFFSVGFAQFFQRFREEKIVPFDCPLCTIYFMYDWWDKRREKRLDRRAQFPVAKALSIIREREIDDWTAGWSVGNPAAPSLLLPVCVLTPHSPALNTPTHSPTNSPPHTPTLSCGLAHELTVMFGFVWKSCTMVHCCHYWWTIFPPFYPRLCCEPVAGNPSFAAIQSLFCFGLILINIFYWMKCDIIQRQPNTTLQKYSIL